VHTWNESSSQNRTFLQQHQKPTVGLPGTVWRVVRLPLPAVRPPGAPEQIQSSLSTLSSPCSFLLLHLHPHEKHISSISLSRLKGPSLWGGLTIRSRSNRGHPRSHERHPPPSPTGISSIPFLFTHGFCSLGFNVSSMRIQFWAMDLLD
jgi:hypothetical protein